MFLMWLVSHHIWCTQNYSISKVLESCDGLKIKLNMMTDMFEEAVHISINKKVKSDCGVNDTIITKVLATLKNAILSGIQALFLCAQ